MAMRVCLSKYLHRLDFLGARNSGYYKGTRLDNPSMILEQNVAIWTRMTSLEDLQECFSIFEERVCVVDFPARYTPPFWLAHAALTTIYNVMSGYRDAHIDVDTKNETDRLLFELWVKLLTSGPGSSHLEMMDIILKYPHYPLWQYMKTLHGENLQVLVSALKTNFVYQEEVAADSYATLMETHIDKIFKLILRSAQFEEARRGLLDLYAFYLSKMDHVPPHIGPRLSHLCFLICNRYEMENPYMGRDDWVLLRNHLKVIKDIVTHPSFTIGSEAQYRAPLTLEKIFQAAVVDKMLNIMFKDFMSLLLTICSHDNSKKCMRLFEAYKTGLFEQLDFRKGFEETPDWMFSPCIETLGILSKTVNTEPHIDKFIVAAQQLCLLNFTKLTSDQVSGWHDLLVNYIVSGRTLLVREAGNLLTSSILEENNVLNWKTYDDQARLLIDIITDIPATFIQRDMDGNLLGTVSEYVTFLHHLLCQTTELDAAGRVRQNVHKCLLKCLEKDPPVKAAISLTCIDSAIPDHTDVCFTKDVLFCINALLKDERCPVDDTTLTNVTVQLLQGCLHQIRYKRYMAVDWNSLLMSICLCCMTADGTNPDDACLVTQSCDLWNRLYDNVVLDFVELHVEKGTVRAITPLVPRVILAIQESVQKSGTTPVRCLNFMSRLGTRCFQVISDHVTKILELFLDWRCYKMWELLVVIYRDEPGPFLASFEKIFNTTISMKRAEKHCGMTLLEEISNDHTERFVSNHLCELLGTYRIETESTKCHIMNILHNVVTKSPGQMVGCFSMLIDDGRFPSDSLILRAPILTSLVQYREDLSQRTIDYMMKHADSKTDTVALVAMEILVPLIKDRPGQIQKQKVRLRKVWKSTQNERVQELCGQLLPDIKAPVPKSTKLAQKTQQNEKKKGVPVFNRNPKSSSQVRGSKTSPSLIPGKPLTLVRDANMAIVPSVPKIDVSQHETETSVKVESNKHSAESHTKVEGNSAIPEDLSEPSVSRDLVIPRQGALKCHKDTVIQKSDADMVLDNCNLKYSQIQETTADETDGRSLLEKAIIEPTQNDLSNTDGHRNHLILQLGYDLENSKIHKLETLGGMTANSEEMQTIAKPAQILINHKKDTSTKTDEKHVRSEAVKAELHGLETDTDVKNGTEVCLDRSSGTCKPLNSPQVEPSICLCSCRKMKHFIEKLRTKLRDSGYDNVVNDAVEEVSGNPFIGAKLVIVCPDGYEEASDDKLLDEIFCAVDKDIPLVAIKMLNVPWSEEIQAALTGNSTYIRFYSKPGEGTIAGTDWPKYKFCEVLMQLNYLGILPDGNLITNEFKYLWEVKYQLGSELKDGHEGTVDSSLVPDVFISYNWGKLKQVEPLCERLTREKLHCWIGAYQMAGTESLYNKIQQGLQCCRVVLACITNNYHLSEICQRDIRTANHLNRVIIPLLIGECVWPLDGKLGHALDKHAPVRLAVTGDGCVAWESVGMDDLVTVLKQFHLENMGDKQVEENKGDNRVNETKGDSVIEDKGDNQVEEAKGDNQVEYKGDNQVEYKGDNQVEADNLVEISSEIGIDSFEEDRDIQNSSGMCSNGLKFNLRQELSQRVVKRTNSMYEIECQPRSATSVSRRYSHADDLGTGRGLPPGVICDEHGYPLMSARSKSCLIV